MKIVAIGDVHGRDTWKHIVEKEKDADRIVFIGDYFDSFYISAVDQLENFKEIVAYKKANPEKVVLLLGNHDFHYTTDSGDDRYSGYDANYAEAFKEALDTVWLDLKIAHIEDNYIFTHAGVTNTWLEESWVDIDTLNHEVKWKYLMFNKKDESRYGNSKHQSPIWVRPEALVADANQKYVQVVGHTHTPTIQYYNGKYPTRLIMIDCHDTVNQYLVVEGGNPRTESV